MGKGRKSTKGMLSGNLTHWPEQSQEFGLRLKRLLQKDMSPQTWAANSRSLLFRDSFSTKLIAQDSGEMGMVSIGADGEENNTP